MDNDVTQTSANVLTSTVGSVISSVESAPAVDSVPSSSSDANSVDVSARKKSSDDPISSTSDVADKLYAKTSSAMGDSKRVLGKAEMDNEDLFANDCNLSHPPSEKITENVEDIVSDLETLLGNPTDHFSMPVSSKRRHDVSDLDIFDEDKLDENKTDRDVSISNRISNLVDKSVPCESNVSVEDDKSESRNEDADVSPDTNKQDSDENSKESTNQEQSDATSKMTNLQLQESDVTSIPPLSKPKAIDISEPIAKSSEEGCSANLNQTDSIKKSVDTTQDFNDSYTTEDFEDKEINDTPLQTVQKELTLEDITVISQSDSIPVEESNAFMKETLVQNPYQEEGIEISQSDEVLYCVSEGNKPIDRAAELVTTLEISTDITTNDVPSKAIKDASAVVTTVQNNTLEVATVRSTEIAEALFQAAIEDSSEAAIECSSNVVTKDSTEAQTKESESEDISESFTEVISQAAVKEHAIIQDTPKMVKSATEIVTEDITTTEDILDTADVQIVTEDIPKMEDTSDVEPKMLVGTSQVLVKVATENTLEATAEDTIKVKVVTQDTTKTATENSPQAASDDTAEENENALKSDAEETLIVEATKCTLEKHSEVKEVLEGANKISVEDTIDLNSDATLEVATEASSMDVEKSEFHSTESSEEITESDCSSTTCNNSDTIKLNSEAADLEENVKVLEETTERDCTSRLEEITPVLEIVESIESGDVSKPSEDIKEILGSDESVESVKQLVEADKDCSDDATDDGTSDKETDELETIVTDVCTKDEEIKVEECPTDKSGNISDTENEETKEDVNSLDKSDNIDETKDEAESPSDKSENTTVTNIETKDKEMEEDKEFSSDKSEIMIITDVKTTDKVEDAFIEVKESIKASGNGEEIAMLSKDKATEDIVNPLKDDEITKSAAVLQEIISSGDTQEESVELNVTCVESSKADESEDDEAEELENILKRNEEESLECSAPVIKNEKDSTNSSKPDLKDNQNSEESNASEDGTKKSEVVKNKETEAENRTVDADTMVAKTSENEECISSKALVSKMDDEEEKEMSTSVGESSSIILAKLEEDEKLEPSVEDTESSKSNSNEDTQELATEGSNEAQESEEIQEIQAASREQTDPKTISEESELIEFEIIEEFEETPALTPAIESDSEAEIISEEQEPAVPNSGDVGATSTFELIEKIEESLESLLTANEDVEEALPKAHTQESKMKLEEMDDNTHVESSQENKVSSLETEILTEYRESNEAQEIIESEEENPDAQSVDMEADSSKPELAYIEESTAEEISSTILKKEELSEPLKKEDVEEQVETKVDSPERVEDTASVDAEEPLKLEETSEEDEHMEEVESTKVDSSKLENEYVEAKEWTTLEQKAAEDTVENEDVQDADSSELENMTTDTCRTEETSISEQEPARDEDIEEAEVDSPELQNENVEDTTDPCKTDKLPTLEEEATEDSVRNEAEDTPALENERVKDTIKKGAKEPCESEGSFILSQEVSEELEVDEGIEKVVEVKMDSPKLDEEVVEAEEKEDETSRSEGSPMLEQNVPEDSPVAEDVIESEETRIDSPKLGKEVVDEKKDINEPCKSESSPMLEQEVLEDSLVDEDMTEAQEAKVDKVVEAERKKDAKKPCELEESSTLEQEAAEDLEKDEDMGTVEETKMDSPNLDKEVFVIETKEVANEPCMSEEIAKDSEKDEDTAEQEAAEITEKDKFMDEAKETKVDSPKLDKEVFAIETKEAANEPCMSEEIAEDSERDEDAAEQEAAENSQMDKIMDEAEETIIDSPKLTETKNVANEPSMFEEIAEDSEDEMAEQEAAEETVETEGKEVANEPCVYKKIAEDLKKNKDMTEAENTNMESPKFNTVVETEAIEDANESSKSEESPMVEQEVVEDSEEDDMTEVDSAKLEKEVEEESHLSEQEVVEELMKVEDSVEMDSVSDSEVVEERKDPTNTEESPMTQEVVEERKDPANTEESPLSQEVVEESENNVNMAETEETQELEEGVLNEPCKAEESPLSELEVVGNSANIKNMEDAKKINIDAPDLGEKVLDTAMVSESNRKEPPEENNEVAGQDKILEQSVPKNESIVTESLQETRQILIKDGDMLPEKEAMGELLKTNLEDKEEQSKCDIIVGFEQKINANVLTTESTSLKIEDVSVKENKIIKESIAEKSIMEIEEDSTPELENSTKFSPENLEKAITEPELEENASLAKETSDAEICMEESAMEVRTSILGQDTKLISQKHEPESVEENLATVVNEEKTKIGEQKLGDKNEIQFESLEISTNAEETPTGAGETSTGTKETSIGADGGLSNNKSEETIDAENIGSSVILEEHETSIKKIETDAEPSKEMESITASSTLDQVEENLFNAEKVDSGAKSTEDVKSKLESEEKSRDTILDQVPREDKEFSTENIESVDEPAEEMETESAESEGIKSKSKAEDIKDQDESVPKTSELKIEVETLQKIERSIENKDPEPIESKKIVEEKELESETVAADATKEGMTEDDKNESMEKSSTKEGTISSESKKEPEKAEAIKSSVSDPEMKEDMTEETSSAETELSKPAESELSKSAEPDEPTSKELEELSLKLSVGEDTKESVLAEGTDSDDEDESKVSFPETETSTPKESNVPISKELEVSTSKETEVLTPKEPEISTSGELEISTSNESKVSTTEAPKVLTSEEPVVSTTKEPEVSSSEKSNKTKISTPKESDVSISRELEVSTSKEPEVSTCEEPDVSTSEESKVSTTKDSKVSTFERPKESTSKESNVSTAEESEVSTSDEPDVCKISIPEESTSEKPDVSEISIPEESTSEKPDVSEISIPEESISEKPDVSEILIPEESTPEKRDVSEISIPEESTPEKPDVSKISTPEECEVLTTKETTVSTAKEPEISKLAELENIDDSQDQSSITDVEEQHTETKNEALEVENVQKTDEQKVESSSEKTKDTAIDEKVSQTKVDSSCKEIEDITVEVESPKEEPLVVSELLKGDISVASETKPDTKKELASNEAEEESALEETGEEIMEEAENIVSSTVETVSTKTNVAPIKSIAVETVQKVEECQVGSKQNDKTDVHKKAIIEKVGETILESKAENQDLSENVSPHESKQDSEEIIEKVSVVESKNKETSEEVILDDDTATEESEIAVAEDAKEDVATERSSKDSNGDEVKEKLLSEDGDTKEKQSFGIKDKEQQDTKSALLVNATSKIDEEVKVGEDREEKMETITKEVIKTKVETKFTAQEGNLPRKSTPEEDDVKTKPTKEKLCPVTSATEKSLVRTKSALDKTEAEISQITERTVEVIPIAEKSKLETEPTTEKTKAETNPITEESAKVKKHEVETKSSTDKTEEEIILRSEEPKVETKLMKESVDTKPTTEKSELKPNPITDEIGGVETKPSTNKLAVEAKVAVEKAKLQSKSSIGKTEGESSSITEESGIKAKPITDKYIVKPEAAIKKPGQQIKSSIKKTKSNPIGEQIAVNAKPTAEKLIVDKQSTPEKPKRKYATRKSTTEESAPETKSAEERKSTSNETAELDPTITKKGLEQVNSEEAESTKVSENEDQYLKTKDEVDDKVDRAEKNKVEEFKQDVPVKRRRGKRKYRGFFAAKEKLDNQKQEEDKLDIKKQEKLDSKSQEEKLDTTDLEEEPGVEIIVIEDDKEKIDKVVKVKRGRPARKTKPKKKSLLGEQQDKPDQTITELGMAKEPSVDKDVTPTVTPTEVVVTGIKRKRNLRNQRNKVTVSPATDAEAIVETPVKGAATPAKPVEAAAAPKRRRNLRNQVDASAESSAEVKDSPTESATKSLKSTETEAVVETTVKEAAIPMEAASVPKRRRNLRNQSETSTESPVKEAEEVKDSPTEPAPKRRRVLRNQAVEADTSSNVETEGEVILEQIERPLEPVKRKRKNQLDTSNEAEPIEVEELDVCEKVISETPPVAKRKRHCRSQPEKPVLDTSITKTDMVNPAAEVEQNEKHAESTTGAKRRRQGRSFPDRTVETITNEAEAAAKSEETVCMVQETSDKPVEPVTVKKRRSLKKLLEVSNEADTDAEKSTPIKAEQSNRVQETIDKPVEPPVGKKRRGWRKELEVGNEAESIPKTETEAQKSTSVKAEQTDQVEQEPVEPTIVKKRRGWKKEFGVSNEAESILKTENQAQKSTPVEAEYTDQAVQEAADKVVEPIIVKKRRGWKKELGVGNEDESISKSETEAQKGSPMKAGHTDHVAEEAAIKSVEPIILKKRRGWKKELGVGNEAESAPKTETEAQKGSPTKTVHTDQVAEEVPDKSVEPIILKKRRGWKKELGVGNEAESAPKTETEAQKSTPIKAEHTDQVVEEAADKSVEPIIVKKRRGWKKELGVTNEAESVPKTETETQRSTPTKTEQANQAVQKTTDKPMEPAVLKKRRGWKKDLEATIEAESLSNAETDTLKSTPVKTELGQLETTDKPGEPVPGKKRRGWKKELEVSNEAESVPEIEAENSASVKTEQSDKPPETVPGSKRKRNLKNQPDEALMQTSETETVADQSDTSNIKRRRLARNQMEKPAESTIGTRRKRLLRNQDAESSVAETEVMKNRVEDVGTSQIDHDTPEPSLASKSPASERNEEDELLRAAMDASSVQELEPQEAHQVPDCSEVLKAAEDFVKRESNKKEEMMLIQAAQEAQNREVEVAKPIAAVREEYKKPLNIVVDNVSVIKEAESTTCEDNEIPQKEFSSDEDKQAEYSSKISQNQELKLTITKTKTDEPSSILKIFDPKHPAGVEISPSESETEAEELPIPKFVIKQSSPKVMSPLKITIKPVLKPEELHNQKGSPKLIIKPIIKPDDESKHPEEKHHSPKITIKPIMKPTDDSDRCNSPKITIKPIIKPVEASTSPKIKFKPVVKPEEIKEEVVEETESKEKERIVLKINKSNIPQKEVKKNEDNEKLGKIKVKFSKEGRHAHIVNEEAERLHLNEAGAVKPEPTVDDIPDETATPEPELDMEELPQKIDANVNSPVLSVDSPVSDIAAPVPRKRGRPRKIPLVVREEFKDLKEQEGPIVEGSPVADDSSRGRPKRSCRGPSVTMTLGIKPRKPRGAGRGRIGSRGGGRVEKEPKKGKISESKLKLIKEAAITARVSESLENQDVEMTTVGNPSPIIIEDSSEDKSKDSIIEEKPKVLSEEKSKDSGEFKTEEDSGEDKPKEESVVVKEEIKQDILEVKDEALEISETVIMFEEETRMSADTNTSRAQTPAKQVLASNVQDVVEESQSSVQSSATTESAKGKKGSRLDVFREPEGAIISADQLAEYYWGGGGPFMLQEQVAQFLGIKSFKRKYPGIQRRTVDMQERDFIRESSLASENMCDLGLTAVNSADILDIMYSDFQNKYEEYCKHLRDRQTKDITNKQKALSLAASQEKNKLDIMQQAVESAAQWNISFNKTRREERKACMDLQTFTINYPKGSVKQIPKNKIGHYPIALVPGQYTDYYRTYTPTELNNLPLNTMLYHPINVHNDDDSQSDGSGSDSDSSSSGSDSSDSDSSDEDCIICSPSATPKKAVL